MREQFRVDLRGIVDVIGHHLYSSERVYLRELVQNARDAVTARAELGHDVEGLIEIEPAWGTYPLIVRDNGIGLTADDMRNLLSMIGSTSKRDDFAMARRDFLGSSGSACCLLFSSPTPSRSCPARPALPTRPRCAGSGRATGPSPFRRPHDSCPDRARRCGCTRATAPTAGATTTRSAASRASSSALLDVPVWVGDTLVSQQVPPWKLTPDEQFAWCQENFGFDPMGVIPLGSSSTDVTGAALSLPYTAQPGYRTGDRIYSKGMLVADTDDLVVPRWAFFCRAVIDVGELPLTAAREGLQESRALEFARRRIGFRLLSELILVHGMYPKVYRDIVSLHADGLKALAVHESDVRELLRSTLPYRTTIGDRTIQQLVDSPGPVRYVREADTYHALRDVAVHAGVLLVDASGAHEADLLRVVDEDEHFREVTAHDVIALARPVPLADQRAVALIMKADRALYDEGVSVQVASFEPADRAALWWPADGRSSGDVRGVLVLNASSTAVKRLLDARADTDITAPLNALYVTALLLGRVPPTDAHLTLLRTAVADMIEARPT